MFVDEVKIVIQAGNGGDGSVSFRHEKFIDKGGPDGGDGGDGGSVIFEASNNENTLADFRNQKKITAESGASGSKQHKHGKSGEDRVIKLPVGSVISNNEGEVLADLKTNGEQVVIAHGGKGGFGNAHFVSSVRQAPRFAEKGEKAQELEFNVELKLIAEVGLVGLPNAGKSTLLSVVSNARPTIADYAFTTLTPNLGVVDIDSHTSVLMADIPGLIAGASQGKGLGDKFLKHVERTIVLLHLIDAYSEDIAEAYLTVKQELKNYRVDLTTKPETIAISKIDGYDQKVLSKKVKQLEAVVPKNTKILVFSSISGEGLSDLLQEIKKIISKERSREVKRKIKQPEIPVIRLIPNDSDWTVEKQKKKFIITGNKIEGFARRTDFDNQDGIRRLKDIMGKMGIIKALERSGVEPGNIIIIGSHGSFIF